MSETQNAEKTEQRVSMVWPANLKDQVREVTGPRGLTEFVVEAVQIHLKGGAVASKESELELNEAKELIQLLADRVAMGGDYRDRESDLMELDLPSWISTDGWPSNLARLVKPELAPIPSGAEAAPDAGASVSEPTTSSAPEVQSEDEDDEDDEMHRPMALTKPKESAEPPSVRESKDDLFARIAAAKGVDPEPFKGLKRASELPKPAPKVEESAPEVAPEPVVSAEVPVTPQTFSEPAPVPVATPSNACEHCGSEKVDGECWWC